MTTRAEPSTGTSVPPAADNFRHSYAKDKAQLVRRLARIEGQVAERGEADRYVEEVVDVVRRTLGRPVRSPRSG
jgi:hypothetical protein